MAQDLISTIAQELKIRNSQAEAAIKLLQEGATVPFIARYRKELTGNLDDSQLRPLQARWEYLLELTARKETIIATIREQGKLSPELEQQLLAAETKTRLEDLYLPFRPKRNSKASQAREAGLEPLAHGLLADPSKDLVNEATSFIKADTSFDSTEAVLEGARQILLEDFAEKAELLSELREYLWQNAHLSSTLAKHEKKAVEANKFADYFSYSEAVKKIPSHRALALFRGRREGILKLALNLTEDLDFPTNRIANFFGIADQGRAADPWLKETVEIAWKTKLFTKLEVELLARLKEAADEEAIKVFASNLHDLLLAAPAGNIVTIGLDPGIRTGVKVAVIDATGKLLDYSTIYPFAPNNEWHQSIAELAKLAARYEVGLISIGNGTGSRETERLMADLIKMYPDLKLKKVTVSEAGASVYSASALGAAEFPDLDVTIRGAVSIARRLQDPLAELVKIEAKAIGVGQYQHDVNQPRLARCLDNVVEDCVNSVGVDVNTASVSLLTKISGLNEGLAKQIVAHRDKNGPFSNREEFKDIPRMGEKSFQQAAGFLRIRKGTNPLDSSAIHPEAYPLVEKILAKQKLELAEIMGSKELLKDLPIEDFVDDNFGLPTIKDILKELEKPGRDPRPEFKSANFLPDVDNISQLKIGLLMEGIVTNVTNFGAFVDVGVHQDGLVHISSMTNGFISDPRKIVKAGDIVQVKVVEVDVERKRIGLSMKLSEAPALEKSKNLKPLPKKEAIQQKTSQAKKSKPEKKEPPTKAQKPIFNTAMADALLKLKRDKAI